MLPWRPRQSHVLALVAQRPQPFLAALVWFWLVGVSGGAATPQPHGSPDSIALSFASSSLASRSLGSVVSDVTTALRRQSHGLLGPDGGVLRSRRHIRLAALESSMARETSASAALGKGFQVTASAPSPSILGRPGLSLLHKGARSAVTGAAPEGLGDANSTRATARNTSVAAADISADNASLTTSADSAYNVSHSSTSIDETMGAGRAGAEVVSNQSELGSSGSSGVGVTEPGRASADSTPHPDDTVGNELRRRGKEPFLGLPKLFWAFIADVVAMGIFILCIPWILHIARRRRAAPAAT